MYMGILIWTYLQALLTLHTEFRTSPERQQHVKYPFPQLQVLHKHLSALNVISCFDGSTRPCFSYQTSLRKACSSNLEYGGRLWGCGMLAMKSRKLVPFFAMRRDGIDEHSLGKMISFVGVAGYVSSWYTALLGSICLRF